MCQWMIVVWLALRVADVTGEAFSATANLIQLVESEREMIPTLEEYIRHEERRIADVRRYVTPHFAALHVFQYMCMHMSVWLLRLISGLRDSMSSDSYPIHFMYFAIKFHFENTCSLIELYQEITWNFHVFYGSTADKCPAVISS